MRHGLATGTMRMLTLAPTMLTAMPAPPAPRWRHFRYLQRFVAYQYPSTPKSRTGNKPKSEPHRYQIRPDPTGADQHPTFRGSHRTTRPMGMEQERTKSVDPSKPGHIFRSAGADHCRHWSLVHII